MTPGRLRYGEIVSDLSQGREKGRPERAKSQKPNNCQKPKTKKHDTDHHATHGLCIVSLTFPIFDFPLLFGFWILAFLLDIHKTR